MLALVSFTCYVEVALKVVLQAAKAIERKVKNSSRHRNGRRDMIIATLSTSVSLVVHLVHQHDQLL